MVAFSFFTVKNNMFLTLCFHASGSGCRYVPSTSSLSSLSSEIRFSQAVSSFAVLDPLHRAMSLMIKDQCSLFLSFEVHLENKATETHRNNHMLFSTLIFNKIMCKSCINLWYFHMTVSECFHLTSHRSQLRPSYISCSRGTSAGQMNQISLM